MEKEKAGHPNDVVSPKEDSKQDDMDKAYYKDLYQDLPGEVVDILMQTHPLMGKKDMSPDATSYRHKKGTGASQVETVRKERMKQVGEKIQAELTQNMPTHSEKEDSPSKQNRKEKVISPQDELSKKTGHKSSDLQNTMEYDDENDRIQYVKMKVNVKHHPNPYEQTEPPRKKKKSRKLGKDWNLHTSPEPMDFKERAKEENLDRLYSDEEFEEEGFELTRNKKIAGIVGFVLLVIIGVLLVRCLSLNSQLTKAQQEIANFQDLSSKYEEAQMEKLTLEDEIKVLKGEDVGIGKTTTDDTSESDSAANGEYDIYVAKPSDTIWDISQSVYGNGAYYKKILEANGLTESDAIHEGQKLKIPKQ